MLKVMNLEEAERLLKAAFAGRLREEDIELSQALGRRLSEDVVSREWVPGFDRSAMDGYALRSSDTFGCTEAMPALLKLVDRVSMGGRATRAVGPGECAYVPTGGQIPEGADGVVMMEYAEDMDGLIAVQRPVAPGSHLIFKGDDVRAGEKVLSRGYRLAPKDIGALAALGCGRVRVYRRPAVAVISTGDELEPPQTRELIAGCIRDVNGPMLCGALLADGCEAISLGILPDRPEEMEAAILEVISRSDAVLLSGGSSVGERDAAAAVFDRLGRVLFHGLALKPGKPALAAEIRGKPAFGLPGNPVAAYFVYSLLVRPVLYRMMGGAPADNAVPMVCAVSIPSNHGREECVAVRCEGGKAYPIMGKSGLITTLSRAEGYIRIPRNREGISQGEKVEVHLL